MPTLEDFTPQSSEKSPQKKAFITIRHIPPGDTSSDNEGPDYTFTCAVTPNAKNNFAIPEIVKCPISYIVYHEQVSSKQTRVTGLHFLLIGHNLNRDFSAYSCCVKSVEFHGHLSYTKPFFQILSQLSSLEKVKFVIGSPSQRPYFYEAKDDNIKTVPPNVNAKYLAIRTDIINYKTSTSVNKTMIEDIIASVLERSGHCLPNLQKFYMELPCTGNLSKLTEELIANKWSHLTGKLMTSYCPFAEALFVVPFREEESGSGQSNDLDLELLDILIGRPYTAHSSYAYGVLNPFNGPDEGNSVYYGGNYGRYFPIERPNAPAADPQERNEPQDDRPRQQRIIQQLRRQNVLDDNNQERQDIRNPNLVFRQNPGLRRPVINFRNNDPRRREFPNIPSPAIPDEEPEDGNDR